MDWIIWIVAIAVGLGAASFVIGTENLLWKGIETLFTAFGLQSGKGPLIVRQKEHGSYLVLTVENRGKSPMGLATVEASAPDGGPTYPTPYLSETEIGRVSPEEGARRLASTKVAGGESLEIILEKRDLMNPDHATLRVLDDNGRKWEVAG